MESDVRPFAEAPFPDHDRPEPVLSDAAKAWLAEHGDTLRAIDAWIDQHGMPLAYLREEADLPLADLRED